MPGPLASLASIKFLNVKMNIYVLKAGVSYFSSVKVT